MFEIDRRSLLKVGAGSVTGVALGDLSLLMSDQAQAASLAKGAQSLISSFVFDRRAISQVNTRTGQALQNAYWGVPVEQKDVANSLILPVSKTVNDLEQWVEANCRDGCTAESEFADRRTNLDGFESALAGSVVGFPDLSDIIGESIVAVTDRVPLKLALEFFYDRDLEQATGSDLSITTKRQLEQDNPVTILAPPAAISAFRSTEMRYPDADVPPNITLYGWKLQFRGPETHPLGSCVAQPVNHLHVEVFRQNSSGGWGYILNVHLGAYKLDGRTCFVLFNSTSPRFCWRTCTPTWDELRKIFVIILTAAAAIVGVVVAAWIIAVIAGIAATAVFPVLVALAL